MKPARILLTAIACLGLQIALVAADQTDAQKAARAATRDKLKETLDSAADTVKIQFRQSADQPFVFTAMMSEGMDNVDSLEILITVTQSETIAFRVYPPYTGGYINVDKAPNGSGLMHQLLYFNQTNFLFWGIDDAKDVFSGYTITLESGFPKEAIIVVLSSIHNTDGFVGKLKPFLDNALPAAKQ